MSIRDYSKEPDDNTSISGINIAEGCPPGTINNAIRQIMADVAADVVPGLDAIDGKLPVVATATKPGLVMPDNKTIVVDEDGVLTAVTAGKNNLGIVRPDNSTITISDGVLSVPVASASIDTVAGDMGIVCLAAAKDSTSRNLACTPAGAHWIAMNLSTIGHSGETRYIESSQTWTAPYNGMYTFLLVGGGGAGLNDGTNGGNGGNGGALLVSVSLSVNQAVTCTIGGGGAAGLPSQQGSYPQRQGSPGGATSITISGITYSIAGGGAGLSGPTHGASGPNSGINPWLGTYGTGGNGQPYFSGHLNPPTAGSRGRIRITW